MGTAHRATYAGIRADDAMMSSVVRRVEAAGLLQDNRQIVLQHSCSDPPATLKQQRFAGNIEAAAEFNEAVLNFFK